MNHILLFEPNREKIPRLILLLKRLCMSCTVARTMDEVLSWFSANKLDLTRFDLVLFNDCLAGHYRDTPYTTLLDQAGVPVVHVQSHEHCGFPPQAEVISCHPNDIQTCIQTCLNDTSLFLTEENIQ